MLKPDPQSFSIWILNFFTSFRHASTYSHSSLGIILKHKHVPISKILCNFGSQTTLAYKKAFRHLCPNHGEAYFANKFVFLWCWKLQWHFLSLPNYNIKLVKHKFSFLSNLNLNAMPLHQYWKPNFLNKKIILPHGPALRSDIATSIKEDALKLKLEELDVQIQLFFSKVYCCL